MKARGVAVSVLTENMAMFRHRQLVLQGPGEGYTLSEALYSLHLRATLACVVENVDEYGLRLPYVELKT